MKECCSSCGVFNNFPQNCTKWEMIRKIDEKIAWMFPEEGKDQST